MRFTRNNVNSLANNEGKKVVFSYAKTPYTVGANTFIHPTAIIADNVVIGDNCYIGPYCLIGEPAEWKGRENESKGVIIGNNVRITSHLTIDSGVE